LVERAETAARMVLPAERLVRTRLRWSGHRLTVQVFVRVESGQSMADFATLSSRVEEALHGRLPSVGEVTVIPAVLAGR
jgi:divalent metal cation (Fe/Co/Zn/Cd) transporter